MLCCHLHVTRTRIFHNISKWRRHGRNLKIKSKRKERRQVCQRPSVVQGEMSSPVQRLSAQVSGKAQKYSRMGPRKFVPFPEDMDFDIENIKNACVKYFSPSIGKDVVCDVLAAEQGPSCKSVRGCLHEAGPN